MLMEKNYHNIKDSIFNATADTFENMTFSKVEKIIFYWATLTIKSPLTGILCISIPEYLMKEISQNLYSLEETEVNENVMSDVIAELANTITGQFMGVYLGEEQIFELGLPETGKSDSFIHTPDMEIYPLKIDNVPIWVGIKIKAFPPDFDEKA